MILANADSKELELKKEITNIDELIKEVAVPYVDFAKIENKEILLELNAHKNMNIDTSKTIN